MSPKTIRVVTLCCTILLVVSTVSTVTADYLESSHFNIFQQNAFSMQAEQTGLTCLLSGACEVCQSAQVGLSTDYFHICPDDGDSCNPKLCYYSSVCRCPPSLLQSSLLKCNSTTTLLVEGKTVKVTHNTLITPGTNVPDETCFTTEPFIDSCSPECNFTCSLTDMVCWENTTTGNFSSCDSEGCECKKPGLLQPDCCNCNITDYYLPDCEPLCRNNCRTRESNGGGCTLCVPGFEKPDCCNCTKNRINIDGICKCSRNIHVNGSCKDGYAPADCCECIPGYKKNDNNECVPTCNIDQNIYFLLDGTSGNNEFCSMVIVIQMLVAAFNPGASTSGTKISTVLLSDGVKYNASIVLGTGSSCTNSANKLIELQQEFQECRNDMNNYDKKPYASLCGASTSAVDGLKTIHDLIPNPAMTNSAVVILTDGMIIDKDEDRINIFNSLKEPSLRVKSVTAAGVEGAGSLSASVDNLKLYTLNQEQEDTVLAKTAVDVGIGIVRRMNKTGIICPDLARNVTKALQAVQTTPFLTDNYCRCQNVAAPPTDYRCGSTVYPNCGGSLSISQPLLPNPQKESLSLEEEILAAVENVLEGFEG